MSVKVFISFNYDDELSRLMDALSAIQNRPCNRLRRKFTKFLRVIRSKPDQGTRRAWSYLERTLARLCEMLARASAHTALVIPVARARITEKESGMGANDDESETARYAKTAHAALMLIEVLARSANAIRALERIADIARDVQELAPVLRKRSGERNESAGRVLEHSAASMDG